MIEETEPTKRPRGRPATGRKDYDKIRTAGRQPELLWSDCVTQAEADGDSMTAFITEAIRREFAGEGGEA